MFKHVCYSDKGTNARVKEEQTYMFFIDFMEECELGKLAQSRLLWNSIGECFCTGDAGVENMYGRSKCWSML